jgi:hypothetical protein
MRPHAPLVGLYVSHFPTAGMFTDAHQPPTSRKMEPRLSPTSRLSVAILSFREAKYFSVYGIWAGPLDLSNTVLLLLGAGVSNSITTWDREIGNNEGISIKINPLRSKLSLCIPTGLCTLILQKICILQISIAVIYRYNSSSLLGLLTRKDGTDTLFRNVGKQLPHDAT